MTAAALVDGSVRVDVDDVTGYFRHGWHSWSPAGWIDPDAAPIPIEDRIRRLGTVDPVHAFDEEPGGSGLGAVRHLDGSVTLVGALLPGAWVALAAGALHGTYEDGEPGPWFVQRGAEPEVFAAYAAELGETLGRRPRRPLRVWSSWYGYYDRIDEPLIGRVLDGLAGLAFDVVQIDDGWHRGVGDWEPNDRFPSGMAATAGRIRDAGFRAGIWLSPLIARATSDTARHRSEMLLRDADGEPVITGEFWGGPYYALDPTHPAAIDHATSAVAAAREWGFDYLKLDFLYGAAFPGNRADGSRSREFAYREIARAMREAAGDDCYLLASGAPVLASLGVFDGIRVGPDVAEVWQEPGVTAGCRNAIESTVRRLWLSALVDPDPDVVFFRTTRLGLGSVAAELLRDLARVTGVRSVSDSPEWLLPEERAALAAFLLEKPAVRQLDPTIWSIDGRVVDFSAGFSYDEPMAVDLP